MPEPVPAPAPHDPRGAVERHGVVARVAMVVAGAVFAAAFGALAVLFVVLAVTRPGGPGLVVGALAIAAFLLCPAAYGASLARRGWRGYSEGGLLAAAQAWLDRHLLAVGGAAVAAWGAVLAVAVVRGGPRVLVELQRGASGPGSVLWWGLLGLLAAPVHLVVHELAHAAAGALVRFRVSGIRVGPACLLRDGDRWRAAWSWPPPLGWDGCVAAFPLGDRWLRLRSVAFAAAGCVMNGVVAAAAARYVLDEPPPATAATAVAHGLVTALAWTGVLAVANLLPLTLRSGSSSDGARIAGALARSAGAKALFRIGNEAARGSRPRAWGWSPRALLALAGADARRADALRYHAFLVALDAGDGAAAEEAHRALAARAASLSPALVALLDQQAALADALDGATVNARALLGRLASRVGAGAGPLGLLEAAIALADGEPGSGRAALARWERFQAGSGLGPAGRVGFEWAVEAIAARLEAPGAGRAAAGQS